MARIKGKNTGPELALAEELSAHGLSWDSHARELPGCPDFLFREERVAVFVDGDFWHGRKFHEWRDKLSVAWEEKIAATRRRDLRNRRQLKLAGWTVVRFWEYDIAKNVRKCARQVVRAVQSAGRDQVEPGQAGSNLVARPHGAEDS